MSQRLLKQCIIDFNNWRMGEYRWDLLFKKLLESLVVPKNWQSQFLVEYNTCTVILKRKRKQVHITYTPTDGIIVTTCLHGGKGHVYSYFTQDTNQILSSLTLFIHGKENDLRNSQVKHD